MRLQVQVRSEFIIVGCNNTDTVDQVAKSAVVKVAKLKPKIVDAKSVDNGYSEVRRAIGNSLMDPEDTVGKLLKDGDLIIVSLTDDDDGGEIHVPAKNPLLDPANEYTGRIYFEKSVTVDNDQQYFGRAKKLLVLDGDTMKPHDLLMCERGECLLEISAEAEQRIQNSRRFLDKIVAENRAVYGVSTGFGTFASVPVPPKELRKLQVNLIRSHASGYGKPLPPSYVRTLLALRINVLSKGYSGISLDNVKKLIAAFNAFCVSYVPEQGTVGASGDLAPLAHLALGLLGEGKMWSPLTGWDDASIVLEKNNLQKMELGPKEGLALINGTQMITALGALALERADLIARQADVIAALSLDVLQGTTRACDPDIHKIRPHPGQIKTARRLRSLLHSANNPSQIAESHRNCGKVQDAYTLRCISQVHGIVHDTIDFVRSVITVEMNSATDNPLIFAEREEAISGGNFHGEYPAKVLDYLAIAVHELAQMSERRLERLVNHELSGLPTFLTENGGLNCGFMVVQLSAASLVSENKVLCHPSSVDSIPTSCSQEDHVSMGGFAARKALKVVEHVEAVLAMELLAVCQGMEFLKPLTTTAPLNKVYQLIRSVSPLTQELNAFLRALTEDRSLHPDIETVANLLRRGKVWDTVEPHLRETEQVGMLSTDVIQCSAGTAAESVSNQSDSAAGSTAGTE